MSKKYHYRILLFYLLGGVAILFCGVDIPNLQYLPFANLGQSNLAFGIIRNNVQLLNGLSATTKIPPPVHNVILNNPQKPWWM